MAEWKDTFELEPSLYSVKIVHATTPVDHVVLNIKTDRDLTLLKEKLEEDGFKKAREEKNPPRLRKQEKKLTITVELKELQDANEICVAFDCAKTNDTNKLIKHAKEKWFDGKIKPILKRSWLTGPSVWQIEKKEHLTAGATSTNNAAFLMVYSKLDLNYIKKQLMQRGFAEYENKELLEIKPVRREIKLKKGVWLTCEFQDVSKETEEGFDKKIPMIVRLKVAYGWGTPSEKEQKECAEKMREFYWDDLKPILAKAPTAKQ